MQFLLFLLLLATPFAVPAGGADLRFPLDAPPLLAATFLEYRGGHLHAGIDVKTGGKAGLPVRAPFAGAVSKVYIDENSAGKLLEITSKTGLAVRFAHLDRFGLDLEARVLEARRKAGRRYPVDLALATGEIEVRAGAVVADSGDTGAGPPHLHVELRDGADLVNPLSRFALPDGTPPTAIALGLVPLDAASRAAGLVRPFDLPLAGKGEARIAVTGRFAVTVAAYDRVGQSPNHVGLYGIEATLDGKPLLAWKAETVPIDDRGASGAVYDRDRSTLSEYHYRIAGDLPLAGGETLVLALSDRSGNITRRTVRFLAEPPLRPTFELSGGRARAGEAGRFILVRNDREVGSLAYPDPGKWLPLGKKAPGAVRFLSDRGCFSTTDTPPGPQLMAKTARSGPGFDLDLVGDALIVTIRAPGYDAIRLVAPVEAPFERLGETLFSAALPAGALPTGLGTLGVELRQSGEVFLETLAFVTATGDAGGLAAADGRFRVEWPAGALAPKSRLLLFTRAAPADRKGVPAAATVYALRPANLRARAQLKLFLTAPEEAAPLDRNLIARVDGGTGYLETRTDDGRTFRAFTGEGGDFALAADREAPTLKGPDRSSFPKITLEAYAVFHVSDRGSGVPRENVTLTIDGAPRDFDYFTESRSIRIPLDRQDAAGKHAYTLSVADLAGNRAARSGTLVIGAKEKPRKPEPKDRPPRPKKNPGKSGTGR